MEGEDAHCSPGYLEHRTALHIGTASPSEVTAGAPSGAGAYHSAGCRRRAEQGMASELGITEEKVARWRRRFLTGGIAALQKDAPRPGRPRTVTTGKVKQIVNRTTQE